MLFADSERRGLRLLSGRGEAGLPASAAVLTGVCWTRQETRLGQSPSVLHCLHTSESPSIGAAAATGGGVHPILLLLNLRSGMCGRIWASLLHQQGKSRVVAVAVMAGNTAAQKRLELLQPPPRRRRARACFKHQDLTSQAPVLLAHMHSAWCPQHENGHNQRRISVGPRHPQQIPRYAASTTSHVVMRIRTDHAGRSGRWLRYTDCTGTEHFVEGFSGWKDGCDRSH